MVRLVDDRHEAEEATQEAFLRAWRSIGRFKGDSQFFTWLYRIGVNEAHRLTARRAAGARVARSRSRSSSRPTPLRAAAALSTTICGARWSARSASWSPTIARRSSCVTSRA